MASKYILKQSLEESVNCIIIFIALHERRTTLMVMWSQYAARNSGAGTTRGHIWMLGKLISSFCHKHAGMFTKYPNFTTGIYLMHGGYCLPEYTVISDIALTADNPLHCVLAGSSGTGGGGGQWTGGPENKPLECGEPGSGPFTCSQSSDPTNITLYKKKGALFSESQKYTCTISSQSISVQIKSE